ncbi:hypothetical protein LP417_19415 [Polaromonas sp. P1-6]|nr:hypothetical protein LP417_19415 [Polaromonas sp. P1-6]
MGLIDGGLAFANANFLRNGKARTQYFWRQDGKGVGKTPTQLGYGHELAAADINLAMQENTYNGLVDEGAVYRGFHLPDLEKSVNHGTHVMDLACGPRTLLAQMAGAPPSIDAPPSWALAHDAASDCDIVAVQLDWHTVLDTSGGSMNVHVMDGLMYILSRCAHDTKVAVNVSWGTLAGPHDGSSVLEAAMDELITLKRTACRSLCLQAIAIKAAPTPMRRSKKTNTSPFTGMDSQAMRRKTSLRCGSLQKRMASPSNSSRQGNRPCQPWHGVSRRCGRRIRPSLCAHLFIRSL